MGLLKTSAAKIIVTVALLNLIMLFHGEVFRDIPSKHYREGSVGTHISILLLFFSGITCLFIYRRRRDQIIWCLIGLGFIFLALDEGFMIHERFDKAVHGYFEIKHNSVTDRLDDVLIALYGMIGVFFLYRHRTEILRYPGFLRFLGIGFCFFVLSVLFDVLSNDSAILIWLGFSEPVAFDIKGWLNGLEEAFKLMGGAVFLSGFLHVLQTVKYKTGEIGDKIAGAQTL